MFAHFAQRRGVKALLTVISAITLVVFALAGCTSTTGARQAANVAEAGNSSKSYVYGSDDYFAARIKMYEDAGLVQPGKLTKDHLPWDPNGPTVRSEDVLSSIATAMNFTGENARFANTYRSLAQTVQDDCNNNPVYANRDLLIAIEVDEIIGLLRTGGPYGSTPIDATGGVLCGSGKVLRGTGVPISTIYDAWNNFTPSYNVVDKLVDPLTPPLAANNN
jgi:hypothetical protein